MESVVPISNAGLFGMITSIVGALFCIFVNQLPLIFLFLIIILYTYMYCINNEDGNLSVSC